jgi:K+-sensing histidine kinase KdpD
VKRGSHSAVAPPVENALISEVFHDLSQPLTALQCTLELSLVRDQTAEELRSSVQTALQSAERLRQRLVMVRALNDVADSNHSQKSTDLYALLTELEEDLSLLFREAGKRFEVLPAKDELTVRGDRTQLLRALFYFLEYLFRYSCEGSLTELQMTEGKGSATLHIHTEACLPLAAVSWDPNSPYSCEVELARRTFRAAGGSFDLIGCDRKHSDWQAELPLA